MPTQKEREPELQEPSHRQTMKAVASVFFFFIVSCPLAMRQMFKIRKNRPALGHQEKFCYLFLLANMPLLFYFVKNARAEIRENHKIEQDYLDAMRRQGQSDTSMNTIESALYSLDQDPRHRRV